MWVKRSIREVCGTEIEHEAQGCVKCGTDIVNRHRGATVTLWQTRRQVSRAPDSAQTAMLSNMPSAMLSAMASAMPPATSAMCKARC
eukprot:1403281-Rhodomonas_salina.1